jgi:hypothetical protein
VDEITAGSQAQPLELGFTKLGQLALLILFVWFAIPTRRRKKRKTKDSEIFIDSEEASY